MPERSVGIINNLSIQQAQRLRSLAMPAVLVLLCVVFSILNGSFLSVQNLASIIGEASVTGILAIGMTFVLILGGIDLSVGATVTLTTVVIGLFVVQFPVSSPIAILIGLVVGLIVGGINGALIVKTRVPALIVTLGTASIFGSVASYITQGSITSLNIPLLNFFGQGIVFGFLPVPVIVFLVVAAVGAIVLNRTPFGTFVRAVGSSRRAAALIGLQVDRYRIYVYVLSGLMASLAGIIVAGRLSMASSTTGNGLQLPPIAAAVLGGALLSGGAGTITGTVVGALILAVTFNGLILAGASFFYQLIATGVILILAVAFNETLRRTD